MLPTRRSFRTAANEHSLPRLGQAASPRRCAEISETLRHRPLASRIRMLRRAVAESRQVCGGVGVGTHLHLGLGRHQDPAKSGRVGYPTNRPSYAEEAISATSPPEFRSRWARPMAFRIMAFPESRRPAQ
jgi:hypothetical protein